MRILLIRPISDKMPIIIPNLGLGYLATPLRLQGYEVEILDCAKNRYKLEDFTTFLKENKYDVVGVQIFTCDFSLSKSMIDIVKGQNQNSITVAGGPHVSGLPAYTMRTIPNLDYGFCGEAERSLPKLCKFISGSKEISLKDIPGLVYRKEGEVVINAREMVDELDEIQFPAWDLMAPSTYPDAPQGTFTKSLPIAPIITSRGCPYECTYCGVKSNTGKKFRKRSPQNIISEIEMLHEKYGVQEIHIEDDNFTLDRNRVVEFCRMLIDRKLNLSWACPNGVRLDTLDKDVLQLMERAGCYSFAVGIESGSPKVLTDMNRRMNLETLKEKVRLIAATTKIRMTGFVILGYPTESIEDIEATINLTLSLPIHRAQYSNFLPLPGTVIFDRLIDSREISLETLEWDSFQDNRIVYSPPTIPPQELSAAIKRGFFKFYFRPKIIVGLLKEIHSFGQLWIVLKRILDIFTPRSC